MNMIPFHHIDKPNYLVIQFHAYKNILMLENYCSDPDCHCDEVLLNFAQLNEEQKITNTLLNLRIDIKSGKILEKTILEQSIDADAIIYEFHHHFNQFKDHFNDNNKKVKLYFSNYRGNELPSEIIELTNSNNCVNYQKVFGNINQITVNFQDDNYIIEDQYCMNPSCKCNEVILVIYKTNTLTSDVVIRLDLNNDHFEVLKLNNDIDHNNLINHIIVHKKSVFKSRYNRMKEVGTNYLSSKISNKKS